MKTVTLNDFKKDLKVTPPMQFDQKREKTGYFYFKMLGEKFKESLENGTNPFLPDFHNIINLKPAYDVYNNTKFTSLTQFMLLTKQAELNAPTAAFVSYEIVKKAQNDGVKCEIKKGSKGLVIPVVDEKDWSKIIFKNTWYNIVQIGNSENLLDYCKDRMTEKYVQELNYNSNNYPSSLYKKTKNPATFVFNKPNKEITSLNSKTQEPYQYLAQILNAIDSGKKIIVKPEQADDFRKKTISLLSSEFKPGCLDVCAIKKLSNSAYKFYKDNKRKEYNSPNNEMGKKKTVKRYVYSRER